VSRFESAPFTEKHLGVTIGIKHLCQFPLIFSATFIIFEFFSRTIRVTLISIAHIMDIFSTPPHSMLLAIPM
jgi:hypothetical protein